MIIDYGLSNETRSVCFHCAKVLDFYLLRAKTITFANLELSNKLRKLKNLRTSFWTQEDDEFLVDLYHNMPSRKVKQFESIDQLLSRGNDDDDYLDGHKKKHFDIVNDFKQMTQAQLHRQEETLQLRKEVDFKAVTNKLARNGTDLDKLTEIDELKLKNGSE